MNRSAFLLLLSPLLLGLSGTNARSAETHTRKQYTIAQAGTVQVIQSTGYGVDVDTATRNAVKNALKQVVGSFIDSTTTINKKKVIANGIVNATKDITGKTREYSRGSIRSVNITSITQENRLFRVTATVSVADKEFKNYIEKVAYGDSRVSRGLFAEVATNIDNAYASFDIIQDRIIIPIAKGLAQEISIGRPRLATSYIKQLPRQYSHYDPATTVGIPFRLSLRKDFEYNVKSYLEDISAGKLLVSDSSGRLGSTNWIFNRLRRYPENFYGNPSINKHDSKTDLVIAFVDVSREKRNPISFYAIRGIKRFSRNSTHKKLFVPSHYGNWFTNGGFTPLKLRYLDRQGRTVFQKIITSESVKAPDFAILNMTPYLGDTKHRRFKLFPSFSLISYDTSEDSGKIPILMNKREFLILHQMAPAFLRRLDDIQLTYK